MNNQYLKAFIILVICCLFLPIAALPGGEASAGSYNGGGYENTEKYRIYITKEDKIKQLSAEEYVTGSLFYSCQPEYSDEAIKAMAVCAYTYAAYMSENSDEKYDLSDNPADEMGYLNELAAKEKFGDKYESCLKKFESAAKETKNYLITYEKKPVYAVSHLVSAGKTETGMNVFGRDYPYLTEVQSVGDLLSPNYFSTFSCDNVEFFEKFKKKEISDPGEESYSECTKIIKRSDSGAVLEIKICGKILSGREVRDILGLNSANFDVKYDGQEFVFTVRGKGLLAGMSRYGANYMAGLGSDFKEIIEWYFPECEIKV